MLLSQIRRSVQQIVAGENVLLTPSNGLGIVTISVPGGSGSGGSGASTETLASVTTRGATSTVAIELLNTTNATNTTTGALVIAGGLGVGQDIYAGGDIYSFNFSTSSDRNLKEDIRPIDSALNLVKQTTGRRFKFKESGEESIGYIAQELETVFPELVVDGIDDMKSVRYLGMIAVLTEAVKELSAELDTLKNNMGGVYGQNIRIGA